MTLDPIETVEALPSAVFFTPYFEYSCINASF